MRNGIVKFKPWRFHRIDKASTINSFLDFGHRTVESQFHNSRTAKKLLLRNGTCCFNFQGEHLSVCCNFENRSFFVTGQFATSLRSLQCWKPPFLCYRKICRFSLRARDLSSLSGFSRKAQGHTRLKVLLDPSQPMPAPLVHFLGTLFLMHHHRSTHLENTRNSSPKINRKYTPK